MAKGKKKPITGVPSLRTMLTECRKIGAAVEPIRRTGEVRVIFASGARLTINARRKDGTPELLAAYRRETKGDDAPKGSDA